MSEASAPTQSRLVLELIRGREPIQGVVHADGAARRPFRGWMELVAAVEAARGDGDGARVSRSLKGEA